MKLDIKKYSLSIIAILLIIGLLNSLAINQFPTILSFTPDLLLEMYLFIGLVSIIQFYILRVLFTKQPKQIGFIYIGISLIKMIACIVFIIFKILKGVDEPISAVMNFMGLYFITLFIEVAYIVKNMTKIR